MDAADGLGQNHADVHRLDFGTLQLLHFMGDCVSHHHLQTQQTQRLGLDSMRWFLLELKPTSTSKCIDVFVISGFHFSHLGTLVNAQWLQLHGFLNFMCTNYTPLLKGLYYYNQGLLRGS